MTTVSYSTLQKKMFESMLRIRLIEERIAGLYSEQEMRCPVHLCVGQEAVAVGVCANLTNTDYAFSGHRSHGHYLAKGGNLTSMMAELYGKATGCSRGKGGSMHLVDLSIGFLGATPIVASTIAIAVGTALASEMSKKNNVTVAFFGEGAVEEGVFHESANFAVLKKLPVIFVCENNLYSVYSPMDVRQPKKRQVSKLAKGYGMESFHEDGNNVDAVYRVAREAVRRAKKKGGPTFLEFDTYRWREHCGPNFDDELGYRPKGEFENWKRRCPIENLKKYLLKKRIISEKDIEKMGVSIGAEITEAVSFAKKSPFPDKDALMKNIYAP